jgi:hypothetical protein
VFTNFASTGELTCFGLFFTQLFLPDLLQWCIPPLAILVLRRRLIIPKLRRPPLYISHREYMPHISHREYMPPPPRRHRMQGCRQVPGLARTLSLLDLAGARSGRKRPFNRRVGMSFIVAGCALLIALLVGIVLDDAGGDDKHRDPTSFPLTPREHKSDSSEWE